MVTKSRNEASFHFELKRRYGIYYSLYCLQTTTNDCDLCTTWFMLVVIELYLMLG